MAISPRLCLLPILDTNGTPISGSKIYIYAAGTTTPLSLYTDYTLSTAADNPIIATQGFVPLRFMATASYKIVVTTSAGASVTGYDGDNIDPGVAIGSGALPIANGGTAATTAAGARTALGAAPASDVSTVQSDVSTIQARLGSTGATQLAAGTTVQRPGSPANGMLRQNSTNTQIEAYIAGWLPFLEASGLMASAMPVGSVVASGTTLYTANSNLATNIPYDNTIPQISEGTEIISVSWTPLSTTNKLRVWFHGTASADTNSIFCQCALFRNSGANAVHTSITFMGTLNAQYDVNLYYEFTPAVTTATTLSLRVGPQTTANIRFNGTSSAGLYGGTMAASMLIQEIKA